MKKREKNINLAVIGAGYWGRKAVTEYLQLEKADPAFKLVQICDLKAENLNYFKDVLHVHSDRLSEDYEAVLKSPDVDAVHICTPTETHYDARLGTPLAIQGLCGHEESSAHEKTSV